MEILASEAERFKQQALKLRSGGGAKHRRSDSVGIGLAAGGGGGGGGKVTSMGGGAGPGGLQRHSVGPGVANVARQISAGASRSKVGPGGKPLSRRATATDGISAEIAALENNMPPPSLSEGIPALPSTSSLPVKGGGEAAESRQAPGPLETAGSRQAPGTLEGSNSLPPWFEAIKEKHGARSGPPEWQQSGSSGENSRENSLHPSSAYPAGFPQSLGVGYRGGPALQVAQPVRASRLGR